MSDIFVRDIFASKCNFKTSVIFLILILSCAMPTLQLFGGHYGRLRSVYQHESDSVMPAPDSAMKVGNCAESLKPAFFAPELPAGMFRNWVLPWSGFSTMHEVEGYLRRFILPRDGEGVAVFK